MSPVTVQELKKKAKKLGLKGYSSMRKKELLDLLGSNRSKKSKSRSKSKKRSKGRRKSKSRSKSKKRSKGRRKSKSVSKSPPQKFSGKPSLRINKYFSKIFVINLHDKIERFGKVTKQFKRKGVKYERFIAVDGRCEKKKCGLKKKEMEKKYKVSIVKKLNAPASSLVIGTMLILKEQIKNRWSRILICEDDVVFDPKMLQRFEKGIDELGNENWDLLYLGCGNACGIKGITDGKTRRTPHMTSLSIVDKDEYNWHVSHPDDLRTPIDKEDSEDVKWGKYISIPPKPGGTWAYAYSLQGAKKMYKILKKKITNHIDQMVISEVGKGNMKAFSFDPPIVWHEKGAIRADTDIPWEW
jgi:GR25 family glycosyltransferase involved in LPS biosynthesis